MIKDRERDVATAQSRQTALDTARDKSAAAQNAELKPLEEKETKLEGELQQLTPPKPTEMPEWKPKPVIDAKDYQNFSTALIGMALIGGAVSKGNLAGGLVVFKRGLTGGYLDGNKARADKELSDYKTKFAEAQKRTMSRRRKSSRTFSSNKNLSDQLHSAADEGGRCQIPAGRTSARLPNRSRSTVSGSRLKPTLTARLLANSNRKTSVRPSNCKWPTCASTPPKAGFRISTRMVCKWLVEQTALGGNFKFLDEVKSGGMAVNSRPTSSTTWLVHF